MGQHGLNLEGNQLGDEGWGAIFSGICGHKDSKIMSMDVSSESIGPAGGKLIAEALRTSVASALTELNIAGNSIKDEGITAICNAVQGNKLTKLNVAGNNISQVGATAVAAMVAVTGGLTALDLSQNRLEDEGLSAVCEAIQSNKELASLNFGTNDIGPVGGIAVAAMVAVTGALTVTNLLGNQLDEASAKMLAEVAKQKGISLCGIQRDQTTADFRRKGLKPPDANPLASDLSQAVVTGALTKLSLAKNKLGEEGTKFLCDALVGNNTLKELDLSGDCSGSGSGSNIGGTASAKHVANMLLVNGALTKLSLASNYLKEEGTKAICKALKQNKTLKELDLSGYDNIGRAAGAKHVADMLGVNGALTECNLRNNSSMGEEAQASIRNAVQGKAWFKLRL